MINTKWKKYEKLHIGDRGSAMITALIVSIVVFMFCLTALVVSYSLFAASTKKVTQDQCRELAKTVSMEIQSELESVSHYGDELAALDAGSDSLWQYLRYNICQNETWPYYDAEASGHGKEYAYRYFKMNVTDGDDESLYSAYTDDVSVCIYWENAAGKEYADSKGKTYLYVKVTCTRGGGSSTVTSRYKLNCVTESTAGESAGNVGDTGSSDGTVDNEDSEGSVDTDKTAVNPDNNEINTNERWTWVFISRN